MTAVIMGLLWSRWGRLDWVTRRLPTAHDAAASRWTIFTEAARVLAAGDGRHVGVYTRDGVIKRRRTGGDAECGNRALAGSAGLPEFWSAVTGTR
jgi:hypothetical protein